MLMSSATLATGRRGDSAGSEPQPGDQKRADRYQYQKPSHARVPIPVCDQPYSARRHRPAAAELYTGSPVGQPTIPRRAT